MQITPSCLACIIDDLTGALKLLDVPKKQQWIILEQALDFLQKTPKTHTPSYYITQVHRILKHNLKLEIPFAELRHTCNELGEQLAKKVITQLANLNDRERFNLLVHWAIAGNVLDFRTVGTGYDLTETEIFNLLETYAKKTLAIDHTDKIYQLIRNVKNILYIPDNVGELAFDKLLLQQLKEWNLNIILPIRGGAITSDAIMEDAIYFDLGNIVDKIFLAGPDTLGISLEEMSDELRSSLNEVDLIIAKGQANYYALDELKTQLNKPLISLFTTKCTPVASHFGFTDKVNLAVIL